MARLGTPGIYEPNLKLFVGDNDKINKDHFNELEEWLELNPKLIPWLLAHLEAILESDNRSYYLDSELELAMRKEYTNEHGKIKPLPGHPAVDNNHVPYLKRRLIYLHYEAHGRGPHLFRLNPLGQSTLVSECPVCHAECPVCAGIAAANPI